jgi:acyl-CoA dehydrogenase
VRVPADNLLGTEEGQGFVQLMQQLPQERLNRSPRRRSP